MQEPNIVQHHLVMKSSRVCHGRWGEAYQRMRALKSSKTSSIPRVLRWIPPFSQWMVVSIVYAVAPLRGTIIPAITKWCRCSLWKPVKNNANLLTDVLRLSTPRAAVSCGSRRCKQQRTCVAPEDVLWKCCSMSCFMLLCILILR